MLSVRLFLVGSVAWVAACGTDAGSEVTFAYDGAAARSDAEGSFVDAGAEAARPASLTHVRLAQMSPDLGSVDFCLKPEGGEAIGPLLAPGAMLVTGTDSAVLAGRKAQLQAWKHEFAAPAATRNRYVRMPGAVTVSAIAPVALEQGEWTCTVAEAVTASGTYAAKWRKIGGDWVLEAEIFVTLGCGDRGLIVKRRFDGAKALPGAVGVSALLIFLSS